MLKRDTVVVDRDPGGSVLVFRSGAAGDGSPAPGEQAAAA
jgi:hypothetical protein